MDKHIEHGQGGLPWPEAYKELRAQLDEQWGVRDELYLTRQLSGGKSGAIVYLSDVTSKDFSGQAVLKLDQAPNPEFQEKSEAERHSMAYEAAPDFAERHLPKILHTAHGGESLAILSSVAGRGLEFAVPWQSCDHERQLAVTKRLSRALLEDWNRDARLAPGLQSPQTVLRSWLGYRLDPAHGRLFNIFPEVFGLSPDEPSFTFEGRWYPNPLAFAITASDSFEHLKLRAVLGHIHGDLHGHNVLVSKSTGEGDPYHLIDLAFYENRQFLFFDHGYFALSHLLSERGHSLGPHWRSILDELCPFDYIRSSEGLRGDDVGLLDLLKALRQEVFDWVDRHQTHRLSYMESQFQLAQVAVGLNFANKRIDDRLRRKSVLFAAAVLKDYLGLHNVDWPKHGPPLTLEGPERSITPATVPSQASEATADPPSEFPELPEKPAVAVIPLEGQNDDPDQEYFADGMTDEIILELSRVDWLMVISRGSTFAYKADVIDSKRVGKELGVHYVVEVAVRRTGDRVRVTVKLVDAQAGGQLWAERYDRELKDIFDLQEEIAATIVASIDSKLKAAEREQAKRKTGHFTLWESFQKAMWHFYKLTEEDTDQAKRQMDALAGEAPSFAGAHAALALLEVRKLFKGDPDEIDALFKSAQAHALKAVELDEDSSLARIALSRVFAFQGKYDQAVSEAETAVSLNPSSSIGFLNLAATLLWGARGEEAMWAIDKSIRLSPKGPMLRLKTFVKGLLYYFLDNYSEAEPLIRQAESSRILTPFTHLILAAVRVRQGQLGEAGKEIETARALRPQLSVVRLREAWRTLSPIYRDKLLGDLKRAGLPDKTTASQGSDE